MQTKLANLTLMVNVLRANAESDPRRALLALRGVVDVSLDVLNDLERAVILRNTVSNIPMDHITIDGKPATSRQLEKAMADCCEDCDEKARIAAADKKAQVWYGWRDAHNKKIDVVEVETSSGAKFIKNVIKIRAHSREDAIRIADAVL